MEEGESDIGDLGGQFGFHKQTKSFTERGVLRVRARGGGMAKQRDLGGA